jgi:hypothetical protein
MLMAIFGAGASYDSFSSSPPARDLGRGQFRPPLANELFINLPAFRDHLKKYPQCTPLIPILENAPDVEKVLGSWQAGADDMRLRQLAAIRYYLRDLIYTCERQWNDFTRGVSNYGTVLDQIRSQPKVALVTFNYDTLIERALADFGVRIDSMDGYLADSQFELFKLHGSIDWAQRASFEGRGSDHRWNSPAEIIDHAHELNPLPCFELRKDASLPTVLVESEKERLVDHTGYVPLLPALAIPATGKADFICPKAHLESLDGIIPQVTKIVIVGWRAGEQHFLRRLAQGLGEKNVKVLAVRGGVDGAKETLRTLEGAGIKGDFQPDPGGFSDFVVNNRVEAFLSS